MNCSRCHAEIERGYRFCARCGVPLKPEPPVPESSLAPDRPVSPAGPVTPGPASDSLTTERIVAARSTATVERGARLALVAVAAGALLLVGSAVGFKLTRTRRAAARPATSQPAGTRQASGSTTVTPPPSVPVTPENAAPASLSPPRAPVAAVGPSVRPAGRPPLAATAPPGQAGLTPAIVRRVEPAAPEPVPGQPEAAGNPAASAAERGGSPPEGAAARVEKPGRVELRGAEDALISIEVQDDGERGGSPGPAPRTRPDGVEVRIEPAPPAWSPAQEAARQLSAAREAQRAGRRGEARDAFAEAARLYRLLLNRGGSEAVAARRGLNDAERGLRAAGDADASR